MKLVLILGLFFSAPAFGQVQVDAGASSIYTNNVVGGAGLNLYGANQQTYLGVNVVNHHLLPGGFERFDFRNSTVTAGSQSIAFAFDDIGIGLSCVCVSVKPKTSKQFSISGFAGSTGDGFFFPWASAAPPSHFGSGILVSYKFDAKPPRSPAGCQGFGCSNRRTLLDGLTLRSLDLVSGGKLTAAQSVGYEYLNNFKASLTGGLLNNQRFFDATAASLFAGVNLFATHQQYFESSTVPLDVRGNSVGAGYHRSFFGLFGSLNESLSKTRTTGENVSASVNFGRFSLQEGWYHSRTVLLSHNLSERISRHLVLSQTINQSQGKNFYGVGGSWMTNRLSLSLSHSIQFVLGPRAGFQQITQVSISLRIHDTQLTGQTISDPFGRTRWTGGMESFIQTNLLPSLSEHQHSKGGKYLFLGAVRDENGKPVAGACLKIGKELVYSNETGAWELRSGSNKPQPVVVVVDEFQLGTWAVVSAPVEAKPGDPVTVVVVRRK